MFINFTNHPSENWLNSQIDASMVYGEIMDIPFPEVPTGINENDLKQMAVECVDKIADKNPEAVMVQGEMTLMFMVVDELLRRGIKVLAATTDRRTIEENIDGVIIKKSIFEFSGYREYIRIR